MKTEATEATLEQLDRQRRELTWFLRRFFNSQIDQDEAEAMAVAGYRYMPCGGCGERSCIPCSKDPRDQGEPSRGRRSRRHSEGARFERYVEARLSGREEALPHFLVRGVPVEFQRLPPDERLVLWLGSSGLDQATVAARLGVTSQTAARARGRGLERLAKALWDDDGRPNY